MRLALYQPDIPQNLGTILRLLILVGGGATLLALDMLTERTLFAVVAIAMTFYGLFIAGALKLGPWRKE